MSDFTMSELPKSSASDLSNCSMSEIPSFRISATLRVPHHTWLEYVPRLCCGVPSFWVVLLQQIFGRSIPPCIQQVLQAWSRRGLRLDAGWTDSCSCNPMHTFIEGPWYLLNASDAASHFCLRLRTSRFLGSLWNSSDHT